MKKIISLIFLSILFFNLTHAGVKIKGQEYWSNIKDGPTTVEDATEFIYKNLDDKLKKQLIKNPQFTSQYLQPLYGVWYSHHLGFVVISEDTYGSNIYRMRIIKAPVGYGINYTLEKNYLSNFYKSTKDHEGMIEGTIIKGHALDGPAGEYILHNRTWHINDDGSYRYEAGKGKILMLSDNHFKIEREGNYAKTEYFHKIIGRKPHYDILKMIKKIDRSKKISEYEIQSSSKELFIYFDTKYNVSTKIVKDKFIAIDANGDVGTGQIYRHRDDNNNNGINFITCKKVTGLTYASLVNGAIKEQDQLSLICDPSEISYSNYKNYKSKAKYKKYFIWYNENKGSVGIIFGALVIILILFYIARQKRKVELLDYNKKNKTNFKTYSEYQEHIQEIERIEYEKEKKKEELEYKAQITKRKVEEAKRLKEEQKLEAEEQRRERLDQDNDSIEENSDSLSGKFRRLKSLYKNGTLTKAEFEQAKNKLLK